MHRSDASIILQVLRVTAEYTYKVSMPVPIYEWVKSLLQKQTALYWRPLHQYHEDDGPALWTKFPVQEPYYAGCPLSDDWVDGYYTHYIPMSALNFLLDNNGNLKQEGFPDSLNNNIRYQKIENAAGIGVGDD